MKNKKEKGNSNSEWSWFITVAILTFCLSLFFSYISTTAITKLEIIPAIIILIIVIAVGIIFDLIGVAVTVAKEEEFHARASKKIYGSKTAIKFIRNSPRVANICADVIGDIAGVLSGAISALITLKVTAYYNLNFDIQFLISAIVASLTVSGKAITKNVAKENSTEILGFVSKIWATINIFDQNK